MGIKQICSVNELKKLDVINLCDGSRLGCVHDVEIDLCMGCITAIRVPRRCDLSEIFKKDGCRYYRILWCQIERIGDDTILVRLEEHS